MGDRSLLSPDAPDTAIALVDPARGLRVTYGMLREDVATAVDALRTTVGRALVLMVCENSVASVCLYLSCLEAGCVPLLVEGGEAERLDRLLTAFAPDALLAPRGQPPLAGYREALPLADGRYVLSVSATSAPRLLHDDLALLLTTSGSTGSPKLVRLSHANLLANARSIARYLEISPDEIAAQSLPMHYSYGLSVVNSHLSSGAAVMLSPHSFLQREFWDAFDSAGGTSVSGVPYVYDTLHRLRFDPARHPTLRTMTQAGGALRPPLIAHFRERAEVAGARLVVMYGQTEATARIAYVPWEQLAEKTGSIGVAIPDGRLAVVDSDAEGVGELEYTGPNVMMGYAETAADLIRGDDLGGVLRTGDLATVDNDGFHWLRGRLKRFAKLFGSRVSLDDVEADVESRWPVAAAVVEEQDRLLVVIAPRESVEPMAVAHQIARRLRVPPAAIRVSVVETLPLTANGKKDYQSLRS